MNQSEVELLNIDGLVERITEQQKTISSLKMTHVITPLENPLQIRHARKVLARLKTELTKKQSKA